MWRVFLDHQPVAGFEAGELGDELVVTRIDGAPGERPRITEVARFGPGQWHGAGPGVVCAGLPGPDTEKCDRCHGRAD